MSDSVIYAIGALGLGSIFGSFLNAVSFRFNTGRGVGGRSRCMSCGHTLHAHDLIPLLSYAFLRGRCRYCSTRVSLQYPLVEAVAALLSLGVYLLYPTPLAYTFWLVTWLTILFIVVYDIRHTVIPWVCSGTLAFLALVYLLMWSQLGMWALLAGPLAALPLFLLSLISRGQWMGWADSAFELSLGWFLGLSAGFTALMLAFWSGAIVGVVLMLSSRMPWRRETRGFTMMSEIPFAPFLALGAAVAFFFHVDFFSTLSLL